MRRAGTAATRSVPLLAEAPSPEAAPDAAALEALLVTLRERDGLDLTGYRRATLERRVRNRMIAAGAAGLAEYLERLRADPAESARLLDRLTIKVSRFWRNRAAVEALALALEAAARAPQALSAWSAGCGRGEEPYTLAAVLAGLGALRPGAPAVLATDVDPGALEAGRRGVYGREALAEAPPRAVERWLVPEAGEPRRWAVAPALRAAVAFERHDLVGDAVPGAAPFDLVACRNTLIYFDPPLQRRVLDLLCDAVAPGGLLWLGEAEWPTGPAAARLEVVSRPARIFRRVEGGGDA